MNFFEKELRNLFSSSPMLRDAHYCGRTCLAKLDEDLRVKLQFTTTGYADHYDAIKLAVINRTDGVVDQQLFRFSDIIGQQAVEGRDPINPHIWDYNGRLEWYRPISQGGIPLNRKSKILASALTAALLLTLSIPAFATSGDVAGAVEQTWTSAQGQIKTVVNNVVFPVLDVILAVLFFVKVGASYFDYRKHAQFEFAGPAILFACLLFTLTAPLYIWGVVGM